MRKLLSLLFVCSLVLTAVMFSAQPAAAQDGILPVIENCQISGHAPIGFEVGWDTPFGTISVRGEGFLTPVTLKLPAGVYNNTAIKLWVRDPDGILTLAPFDLTYTGVCPGNILGYYEAQDGRLNKYDPTASFMYYCRTDGIEVWHYAAGEAGFPVFTISYADIYATLTAAAASGQSMFVPGSGHSDPVLNVVAWGTPMGDLIFYPPADAEGKVNDYWFNPAGSCAQYKTFAAAQ